MNDKSCNEIFSNFEEISNNFNRRNQYFDILYDSFSSINISKSHSTEDISVNLKKSGIVARTFNGTWNEIAFDDLSDLKKGINKLPKAKNKGEEITEYKGWKLNKEIIPKIPFSDIPIEEKIDKIREIYNFTQNYDERIVLSRVSYKETNTTRIFVNNEGSILRQVIPRVKL
ncbi:unnamed protein product, partial [marine sediment metagenome]